MRSAIVAGNVDAQAGENPSTIRGAKKPMAKSETQTENAIKREAMERLRTAGWFAWRTEQAHTRQRSFHGTPGAPDICAVKDGRFLAVECKTPTGRQSDSQVVFGIEIAEHGGIYIVYRGGELCLM